MVATPLAPSEPYDLVSQFKQAIALALVHVQHDASLDRNWGAFETMPLHPILAKYSDMIPAEQDWADWNTQRKAIAIIQIAAKKKDIDPGPIDGYWGQRTDSAFEALVYYRDNGELPAKWRDITPIDANPNGWPNQSTSSMTSKFGQPCKVKLTRVQCPWPLRLSWDLNSSVPHISCNEVVAESLGRVLEAIYEEYGRSDAEMRRLRLDRYGGCYNCRSIRGGSSWSTHAWGIAIDWDPDLNKLRWGRDRARLAKPEYDPFWEIWEKEGWLSLGRHKNFDWMHVQAARL